MSDLGNKIVMAKNIKKYMRRTGKTQKELCTALGFKESTFSDWVTGKKYPRIDKIERMANYFGISKADLVDENTVQPRSIALSSDELDLVKKYRELDEENQEELLDILNIKVEKVRKKVIGKEETA